MKRIFIAAMMIMTAMPAIAQSAPATNDTPTPAVVTSGDNTSGMPLKGSNSFTEGQAKSRIEARGYTDVMGLSKDQDGVWRGKGSKAGATHDVAVDYQGNVFGK